MVFVFLLRHQVHASGWIHARFMVNNTLSKHVISRFVLIFSIDIVRTWCGPVITTYLSQSLHLFLGRQFLVLLTTNQITRFGPNLVCIRLQKVIGANLAVVHILHISGSSSSKDFPFNYKLQLNSKLEFMLSTFSFAFPTIYFFPSILLYFWCRLLNSTDASHMSDTMISSLYFPLLHFVKGAAQN